MSVFRILLTSLHCFVHLVFRMGHGYNGRSHTDSIAVSNLEGIDNDPSCYNPFIQPYTPPGILFKYDQFLYTRLGSEPDIPSVSRSCCCRRCDSWNVFQSDEEALHLLPYHTERAHPREVGPLRYCSSSCVRWNSPGAQRYDLLVILDW